MERLRQTPREVLRKMVMPLATAGIIGCAYTLGDLYLSTENRIHQVENLSLENASPEELASARASLNEHLFKRTIARASLESLLALSLIVPGVLLERDTRNKQKQGQNRQPPTT